MNRTSLVVRDMERSLTLYRDVLGFSVEGVRDWPKDSYSYPVFDIPPEASIRSCTLSSPAQWQVLGLTEVTGTELPPWPSPRPAAMVVHVDDLEEVVKGAESHGFRVHAQHTLTTKDGKTGVEAAIVDPDGHILVVYNLSAAAD